MNAIQMLEKEMEIKHLEYELKIKTMHEELLTIGIGDLKWFCEKNNISRDIAKDKILLPFRRELEGKIVSYPAGKGVPYRFNKRLMMRWIEENFERIEW